MKSTRKKVEVEKELPPEVIAVAPPTNNTKLLMGIAGLLLALSLFSSGAAYYFYSESKNRSDEVTSPLPDEARSLVEEIGKLIVLPIGEEPTVATVSDPEPLKNQPFFANAKVGDKVLLYPNAKKAYLYDPVAKKILEVAPLDLGAGTEVDGQISPGVTTE